MVISIIIYIVNYSYCLQKDIHKKNGLNLNHDLTMSRNFLYIHIYNNTKYLKYM